MTTTQGFPALHPLSKALLHPEKIQPVAAVAFIVT
jgi:hypothetical protein